MLNLNNVFETFHKQSAGSYPHEQTVFIKKPMPYCRLDVYAYFADFTLTIFKCFPPMFKHAISVYVSTLNTELRSPCADDPCLSRGKCILKWSKDNELTYECKCGSKYKGDHCEHGNKLTDLNTYHCLLIFCFLLLGR